MAARHVCYCMRLKQKCDIRGQKLQNLAPSSSFVYSFRREVDGAECIFDYVCQGGLCDIGSGDFHIETRCDPRLNDVTFVGEDPNLHNRYGSVDICPVIKL